ncbi:MAG: protein kinase, partial [Gemmatimonadales bacterium]
MRVRLKQQRLLEMLAQSSLSQNHWAIKLGISRGHWSEIVNGKHPYPSPKTRDRLLEVFNVEFDDLFAIESGPAGVSDANFQAAIADRYLIEKELGHGGMGTVYLARDVKHGRLVAVKVVSPEAVSGIGADQFLKEIRYTARLEHHHILGLHDSGQAAGYPFYVMPYIRGGSLRERLVRDGRLTVVETSQIAGGVAAALTYAHERQMLHCDVKPENILLSEDHPYVADFGISRAIHSEMFEWGQRREIDSSAGTPAYVSPEQATGEQQLDARSDVYSLGCVVFEMLSGVKPFTGTNTMEIVSKRFRETVPDLRQHMPHIPRTLAAAVAGAMQLDPKERTVTPKDFVAELERSVTQRSWPVMEHIGPMASSVWSFARSVLGLDRRTRRGALMESIWQDARHITRSLLRKPAFTVAAVGTLALGIGATTAIFSVVNSVLLRPLAYADPGRLVVLEYEPVDEQTRAVWAAYDDYMLEHMKVHVTYPNFELWRETTGDILSEVGIYDDSWTYPINLGAGTEILPGTLVSAGLLRALGVQPVAGRWFHDEDDALEAPGTIMLSYGLWQRRFGGSPDVIGTTVTVRERPHTVVGVMPRDFDFPTPTAQLWMPLAWASRGPGSTNYQVVGRVGEGRSVQQARSMLEARALEVEWRDGSHRTFGASATVLRNHLVGDSRSVLLIFMAAVTAVLLIACVNVVNLMLTRATGQEHEHTVRAAIGAGPRRLAQQLLTESAIVSLLGAGLGVGVAFVLLD